MAGSLFAETTKGGCSNKVKRNIVDPEHPTPLPLVLWTDKDCPVCGLGNAFEAAQQYGVCARCGWCDEPDASAYPDAKSETNEESLNGARLSWPERLVARLVAGPLSTLRIARRAADIRSYDFVVDGVPLRETFATSPWDLYASADSWPFRRGWANALLTGASDTPTGRCLLYGDDPYDASLTAEVRVGPERVIWSRIGIETFDWTPERWELNARHGPAGFAFDIHEYRNAFAAAHAGQHGIDGARPNGFTCRRRLRD